MIQLGAFGVHFGHILSLNNFKNYQFLYKNFKKYHFLYKKYIYFRYMLAMK